MEVPSHALFATLLPRVKALAQQNKLSTQSISNIAWACAKAGKYEAELFDELAKCAAPQMQRFNVQVRGHRWGEAGRSGCCVGVHRLACPACLRSQGQDRARLVCEQS